MDQVTLMDWGNAIVSEIKRDESGKILSLQGKLNPEGNVKNTKKKLQWVCFNLILCFMHNFQFLFIYIHF